MDSLKRAFSPFYKRKVSFMKSIGFKLHCFLLSSLCCGIITVFLGCGSNQNPAGVAEPDNSTGELHPGGLISLHEDIPGVTKLPLSKIRGVSFFRKPVI